MEQKISDHLGRMKSLLNSIMELEWFIGFLLLITCLDLYFTLKYNISVITAANQWRFYFTKAEDYIYFALIFSMIFTMVFPALKWFHIFVLSGLLYKIGIDCYGGVHKNYKEYRWIRSLELDAARENNEVLWKYLIKEKERDQQKSRVSVKFLSINLFVLIQCTYAKDVNNYPILINTILEGFRFCEQQNFVLRMFFCIGLAAFIGTWLMLFFRAFLLPDNNIYFPDDKGNKNV